MRSVGPKGRARAKAPGVRFEEVANATVWRLHTARRTPDAIAAEINEKWGNGNALTDGPTVAAWIEQQAARRASTPKTRLQMLSRLETGLELLRGELAIAFDNLETDHQSNGRAGAFIALGAVCDFLEGFADVPGGKLADPLRALMVALKNLDEGVANPMLERAVVCHRTRGSDAWHIVVSFAVAAMEAAKETGLTLDQAAARVSRDLHRRGFRQTSGKAIDGATVRNWRARATEGPGGSYDQAAASLALVRSLTTDGRQMPADGWKRVLDRLEEWVRVAGVRKKLPG